jgi:acetyl-CoA carboxylase alpha subunit
VIDCATKGKFVTPPVWLQVRKAAEENGVDVSDSITELEARAIGLRQGTYSRLTPTQRLQIARHPSRPTFMDIAYNITDKFVEVHGDRAGLDDKAIVCGLTSIDGISFMMIGQQKGRNTKENIKRNFAMPQPNGYRKAMRYMKCASAAYLARMVAFLLCHAAGFCVCVYTCGAERGGYHSHAIWWMASAEDTRRSLACLRNYCSSGAFAAHMAAEPVYLQAP